MFGAGPQDRHGYVMNRLMPHFDFHAGDYFRLFPEFEFDYEDWRNGGPRPDTDEDRGDIHQALLEIGPHASRPHGMSLRVGRQEVVLGLGPLFDNNEGPYAKLSFDGFRAIAEGEHVRLDLFALRPVPSQAQYRLCTDHGSRLASANRGSLNHTWTTTTESRI
jgi:hypothetical protein